MAIEPGKVYPLSPLVRRITAPNGGRMTGPGTNTYLVGKREVAIIDPGPLMDSHVQAVLSAVGDTPVRWIIVTHTHPDHSPAAKPLLAATGAQAVGAVMDHGDGHQDVTFQVQRNVEHGERFETDEYSLEAIFTPGHIGNHFSFLLREEQLLFAGDHIMEGASIVIIPPSGDLLDFLESLERLKQYDIAAIAPAHGNIIHEPDREIDRLIAHRHHREQKIVAVMRECGEASLGTLVARVYADLEPRVQRAARYSLWAHLLKLEKEGRAHQTTEQHWVFGEEVWSLLD